MKRVIQIGAFVLGLSVQFAAAAPVVSNVSAIQRAGTKLVDISYDVTGAGDVTVSVVISNATGAVNASSFSGDIGQNIATGSGKAIVWDGEADQNGQALTGLQVYITASEGDTTPPTGMVAIPAGSFMMGKLGATPGHYVELSPYFMDETEVTKSKWDTVNAWGDANGYDIGYAAGKAADHPAQNMQWHSAVKWCNARSEMDGLTPCYRNTDGSVFKSGNFNGTCDWTANGYRLPTEAQWEFAAHGTGTDNFYPWLDSNTIDFSRANYCSPVSGYHPDYTAGGVPYTSPAGTFAPNAYGLYDMAGNVFEWTWDWYASSVPTTPVLDPTGPATGQGRVIRGGSWENTGAADYLVAWRNLSAPNGPTDFLGFRCAKAAATVESATSSSPAFDADFSDSLSGFAAWADERGLTGDLNEVFNQDHDNDGIMNGLEYAFGSNLPEGAKALCIQFAGGRAVAQTPMQDPDTVADATVWVEFSTTPYGEGWTDAVHASDTTGKPETCCWWEPYPPTDQQVYFRLKAAYL